VETARVRPSPRGRLLALAGGRRLRVVTAGPMASRRPLVALEAGAFGFSADWAAVQARLAEAGFRSVAYDRAGLGFSDPGPEPRHSLAILADFERMLADVGGPAPLVLCGHSMAGLHLRLAARALRERLSGVALIDAVAPEAMESPLVSRFVGGFSQASRLAAWGAEAGLLAPLADAGLGNAIGVSGAAAREKRWAFADPGHNRWAAREVAAWPESARQAREAGPLDPDLPTAVVIAGPRRATAGTIDWRAARAAASRRGRVFAAEKANHASLLGEAFADVVVSAVEHAAGAA